MIIKTCYKIMVIIFSSKHNPLYGKCIILFILLVGILFNTCQKKESQVHMPSPISYYLANYDFQKALDVVKKGDFSQSDIPSIIELYYLLMRISFSAYQNSLILYEIGFEDYLSIREDRHPALIPAVEYFLGRIYLLSNQLDKARTYFKQLSRSFPQQHSLYPRVKLLAATFEPHTAMPSDVTISQQPILAARLHFISTENMEELFKADLRKFSLQELDRAMIALHKENYGYLDKLLNNLLFSSFYNELLLEDSLDIWMYDPESLYLRTMYFSHKAKEFAENLDDKILKAFYEGWISFYQGNYKRAIKQFTILTNSATLDEVDRNSLLAIKNALLKDESFSKKYSYSSIKIDDYFNLKPALTYWFYKWWIQREEVSKSFFSRVDEAFSSLLSPEMTYIPGGMDECDFKELLFITGRYFVLTRQSDKSGKYFTALYNIDGNFDLKYSNSCGLSYDFHPAVSLTYSSTALINTPNLNELVLRSIVMESIKIPLYRELVDAMKIILSPQRRFGEIRH